MTDTRDSRLRGNVKIRYLEQNDLLEFAEILLSFENHFCGLDKIKEKKSYITKEKLFDLHFSENKFMRTLVAENYGKICGVISFYNGFLFEESPQAVFHLPQMFVINECRNTNIVYKLLLSVREIARQEKIEKLVFSVYGLNKSVAKHYEKLGAKYFADENEHFMFFNVGE